MQIGKLKLKRVKRYFGDEDNGINVIREFHIVPTFLQRHFVLPRLYSARLKEGGSGLTVGWHDGKLVYRIEPNVISEQRRRQARWNRINAWLRQCDDMKELREHPTWNMAYLADPSVFESAA